MCCLLCFSVYGTKKTACCPISFYKTTQGTRSDTHSCSATFPQCQNNPSRQQHAEQCPQVYSERQHITMTSRTPWHEMHVFAFLGVFFLEMTENTCVGSAITNTISSGLWQRSTLSIITDPFWGYSQCIVFSCTFILLCPVLLSHATITHITHMEMSVLDSFLLYCYTEQTSPKSAGKCSNTCLIRCSR